MANHVLRVSKLSDHARKEIGKDEDLVIGSGGSVSSVLEIAPHMHDAGEGVLVDRGPNSYVGENGFVGSHPVLDPGTNDPDDAALTFDGAGQGAVFDEIQTPAMGAMAAWVRVNELEEPEGGEEPTEAAFLLAPTVSGYSALPDELTINSVTRTPDVRFRAEDCDGLVWKTTAGDRFQSAYFAQGYSVATPGVANAYYGVVRDPIQKRIYFIPMVQSNQTNWHYIDEATGECVSYAHGATAVVNGYVGGCYDPVQERIYFAPHSQGPEANWHYIDCNESDPTQCVKAYAHGTTAAVAAAYAGAVYDPINERVVFVPYSQFTQTHYHRIVSATGAAERVAHGLTGSTPAYWGGAYDPVQQRIHCAPDANAHTATLWRYFDCKNDTWAVYTHGATGLVNSPYRGAAYSEDDNRVYFGPLTQGPEATWHYIDCAEADPATALKNWTHGATVVANGYHGVCYNPAQKRVYFSPLNQATQTNWHYIEGGVVRAYLRTGVSTSSYRDCVYSTEHDRVYMAPAGQATASTWYYIGGVPVTDHGPGLGEQSVWCDPDATAGKLRGRFESENTGFLTLGLKDLVCEWVGSTRGNVGNSYVFSDWQSTPSRVVGINYPGSGRPCLQLRHDTDYFWVGPSTAVPENEFNHWLWVLDRSGSGRCYLNGVAVGTASISALVAQTLGGGRWQFTGHRGVGATASGGDVSHLAIWTGQDWLDTHEQDSLAMERFQRACGIWPDLAKGTSAAVAARAGSAYLDKSDQDGERILVPVGAGWIRTVERTDSASDDIAGVYLEPQSTNELLSSETLTEWALTRCALSTATETAPDGQSTMLALIASADDDTHSMSQSCTSSAVGHVLSCWAKAGSVDWLRLQGAAANASCYFDLATGAIGTASAGVDAAGIEAWANDTYRCWIRYAGVAESHSHVIGSAFADEDDTFLGDAATASTWIWGVQHEAGIQQPSSYIPTVAAKVTRLADSLRYNADSLKDGRGRIECRVLGDNEDTATAKTLVCLHKSASSATDNLELGINPTGDVLRATSAASGGSAGDATIAGDVTDGTIQTVSVSYRDGKLFVTRDGVKGTADTTVDIPRTADRLEIGQKHDGSQQPGMVIADLKVFDK